MIALVDKIAAWLVVLLGLAHLAVGHAAFLDPIEQRVWFASAGFLLILVGLSNLAAATAAHRLSTLAALFGSLTILAMGALLVAADPAVLTRPPTIVLLALGLILTVQRLRGLTGSSTGA